MALGWTISGSGEVSWRDAGYWKCGPFQKCVAASKQPVWTCANIMVLALAQHMSSLLLPHTTQLQSKSLDLVAYCTKVKVIVAVTLQEFRRFIWIIFFQSFWTVPNGWNINYCSNVNWQPETSWKCNHFSVWHGPKWRSALSSQCVNVFYLFLDYMLTELNDSLLCHRTNAFALQCLVPKCKQTSS